MTVDEGNPFKAVAAGLETVAGMIRGGIVHDVNTSVTTGVEFHYSFAPTFGEGIYLDGDGKLVVVDDEGDIFEVINQDGTEDPSLAVLPAMDPMAWASAHGGLRDIDKLEGTGRGLSEGQEKYMEELLSDTPPQDPTDGPEGHKHP